MAKSYKKQRAIDSIAWAERRLAIKRDMLSIEMRKVIAIEDELIALKTELRKIEEEEATAFLYALVDQEKKNA